MGLSDTVFSWSRTNLRVQSDWCVQDELSCQGGNSHEKKSSEYRGSDFNSVSHDWNNFHGSDPL